MKRLVHGTRTAYTNYQCRCMACVHANRVYQRQWMQANRQQVKGTEPPTHGTLRAYQHFGCRCDLCRQANSDYRRQRRRGLPGKVLLFGSAVVKTARGSEPTGRLGEEGSRVSVQLQTTPSSIGSQGGARNTQMAGHFAGDRPDGLTHRAGLPTPMEIDRGTSTT